MNVSKLKASPAMVIAWRCRILASTAVGWWVECHIRYQKGILSVNLISKLTAKIGSQHLLHQPRLDSSSGSGTKVVVPIRPVLCLSGNLDINDSTTRLMWRSAALLSLTEIQRFNFMIKKHIKPLDVCFVLWFFVIGNHRVAKQSQQILYCFPWVSVGQFCYPWTFSIMLFQVVNPKADIQLKFQNLNIYIYILYEIVLQNICIDISLKWHNMKYDIMMCPPQKLWIRCSGTVWRAWRLSKTLNGLDWRAKTSLRNLLHHLFHSLSQPKFCFDLISHSTQHFEAQWSLVVRGCVFDPMAGRSDDESVEEVPLSNTFRAPAHWLILTYVFFPFWLWSVWIRLQHCPRLSTWTP